MSCYAKTLAQVSKNSADSELDLDGINSLKTFRIIVKYPSECPIV